MCFIYNLLLKMKQNQTYVVESIEDKRLNPRNCQFQYLIKWKDFPYDQNTWQPQENLKYVKKMVNQYNQQVQMKRLGFKQQKQKRLDQFFTFVKLQKQVDLQKNPLNYLIEQRKAEEIKIQKQKQEVKKKMQKETEKTEKYIQIDSSSENSQHKLSQPFLPMKKSQPIEQRKTQDIQSKKPQKYFRKKSIVGNTLNRLGTFSPKIEIKVKKEEIQNESFYQMKKCKIEPLCIKGMLMIEGNKQAYKVVYKQEQMILRRQQVVRINPYELCFFYERNLMILDRQY